MREVRATYLEPDDWSLFHDSLIEFMIKEAGAESRASLACARVLLVIVSDEMKNGCLRPILRDYLRTAVDDVLAGRATSLDVELNLKLGRRGQRRLGDTPSLRQQLVLDSFERLIEELDGNESEAARQVVRTYRLDKDKGDPVEDPTKRIKEWRARWGQLAPRYAHTGKSWQLRLVEMTETKLIEAGRLSERDRDFPHGNVVDGEITVRIPDDDSAPKE